MQEDSPYSPPKAGYAGKGHIVYEEMLPLSLTQRLNRLRYACYQLTTMVIFALLGVLAAVFAGAAGLKEQTPLALALVVIFGIMIVGMGVYMFALSVRRLHDLGHSGWLVLLMLLPIVVLPLLVFIGGGARLVLLAGIIQPLFMLYLYAGAGTAGMNSYGTPNPPNGMLVMVFGGLWWVLCVLALLLNIAMAVFSVFAPELLTSLGVESQLQQFEELEQLLKAL
ncbi:DUF805 domain-containing protein [Alcanivorax sp. 1008]|uniref:DUF805 domain-containing protein n=1 Tax=Alcanivorax sp. 1008 TaxID=2816853 RepID=UPI001DDA40A0|nr:DUF805 domain-containing protein [Alcanivorax sp. 1008]MCC1498024.1 DUF805 domain-containing protein [Alcanivorax sp. 1008]